MYYPVTYQTNLANPARRILPRGKYTVKNFSHAAIGGCDQATIDLTDTDTASLLALFDFLRAPIEIWDEAGHCWWWGYINAVTMQIGALQIGAALDEMANRVRVTWTDGKTTTTNDFTQDDYSVATYGKKERTENLAKNSNATESAQRQAIMLNNLRFPLPKIEARSGANNNSATISCNGWYRALGWQFYSKAEIVQSNINTVPTPYDWMLRHLPIGFSLIPNPVFDPDYNFPTNLNGNTDFVDWGSVKITIGGTESFWIDKIGFMLATAGSGAPTASLRTCTAGNLNIGTETQLAYGTFPGGQGPIWQDATLNVSYFVNPGEVYLLGCLRSLTTTWTGMNYVPNVVNDSALVTNFGSSGRLINYSTKSPQEDAALLWQIHGNQDNSEQAKYMMATAQFVAGVDSLDTSGIIQSAYRDGSQTIQNIIEEICNIGTSNNRRLLATVTRDRRIRLYEEPTATRDTALVTLSIDGSLRGKQLEPLNIIPVGQWCAVRGINLPSGAIIDPTLFFIERAEMNCDTGEWTITPRGMQSPWQLGGISNG